MHTCVYLTYVGAVLLPLVMVNSDSECNNNDLTNDNYYGYLKLLVWQLRTMPAYSYSTFHHSINTGSSALESCHCGGYAYYKHMVASPYNKTHVAHNYRY